MSAPGGGRLHSLQTSLASGARGHGLVIALNVGYWVIGLALVVLSLTPRFAISGKAAGGNSSNGHVRAADPLGAHRGT